MRAEYSQADEYKEHSAHELIKRDESVSREPIRSAEVLPPHK